MLTLDARVMAKVARIGKDRDFGQSMVEWVQVVSKATSRAELDGKGSCGSFALDAVPATGIQPSVLGTRVVRMASNRSRQCSDRRHKFLCSSNTLNSHYLRGQGCGRQGAIWPSRIPQALINATFRLFSLHGYSLGGADTFACLP